jgi:protein-S-isoprenylcysteine O-methyltransferase Ste14
MKKINPPLLYQIFIGLMGISLFLPIKSQILFPYNLVGFLPFLFGTYLAVASKKLFRQTDTPVNPTADPTQLHQSGFFKYSRNPMYLGIAIGLLGLAVLTGHPFNIIYSILYIILCDVYYVRAEERKLKKIFGSKFTDYTKKARRWI